MKAKYAITLGFLGLILLGAIFFMLPIAGSLGFSDALFTACSAVCITGLSVVDIGDMTLAGQIALLVLVQIGCVGIMVLGTFILMAAGRRLSLSNEFSLSNAYGVKGVKGVKGLVVWVILSMCIIELAGMWALNARGMGMYEAYFYAVMSFCNAGFTLAPGAVKIFSSDPLTLVSMNVLTILGGIGFVVMYNVCTIKFWKRSLIKQGRLSLHTRVVIWTTVAFVLVAFVVVFACEATGALRGLDWPNKLAVALFQAVTPRTCGFSVVPMDELRPVTRFFSEMLMFIGAAPGSAGGGIKLTTFVVFLFTMQAICKGQQEVVISKRRLPSGTVREVLVIVLMYLMFTAAVTGALLVSEEGREGLNFEKLLFEAISAVSTTGLSYTGTTAALSLPGRIIVMLAMFTGRLGALTVVMMMSGDEKPAPLRYPEEQIIVG